MRSARPGPDTDGVSRAAAVLVVIALACLGGAAQAPTRPGGPSVSRLPGLEPLEHTRRQAAGGAELGRRHLLDRGSTRGFTPTSARASGGGSPIGIPFDVVSRSTKRSRPTFEYDDESDHVGYPIPKGVHIEGGSDHHALLLDKSACRLYELGGLERRGDRWHAWAGATWNLRSNRVRPAGWTSADAAGLPIFPGLARYDEVRRGVIDHALRFTVERTRRAYLYPARHFASDLTSPNLPPMGLRVRLKASFDVRPFPRQARIVLVALKRYGMIVADNGSDWYITGAPNRAAGRTTSCTPRPCVGLELRSGRHQLAPPVTFRSRRRSPGPRTLGFHESGRTRRHVRSTRAAVRFSCGASPARRSPVPIFPESNPWNSRVDRVARRTQDGHHSIRQTSGLPISSVHVQGTARERTRQRHVRYPIPRGC